MQEGVEGLLKDKTRPSRKPPLSKETASRVVELTQGPPLGESALDVVRHGQGCGYFGEPGAAHLAQPRPSAPPVSGSSSYRKTRNSLRSFGISLGLYGAARVRARFSIDEKSQIQALDRTQPGLPIEPRA